MIMILGDLHTDYSIINSQIEYYEKKSNERIDAVIQLGDFGIYREPLEEFFILQNHKFLRPVFFIDGNHEDFWNITTLSEKYKEYFKHLKRGDVHNIGDYRFLSFGGAAYMDPINTPPGSVITKEDVRKSILHNSKEVDIVISHDCPEGIGVPGTPGFEYCGSTGFKEGKLLLRHFKPEIWFFAHYHKLFSVYVGKALFLGLGLAKNGFAVLKDNFTLEIVQTSFNNSKPKKFFNLFNEIRR
ncbi:MAG: hypothetical protein GY730_05985 [bacterium]|nr:hypothetical protein [bacterium]